ncbi:PssE/Cps14G family polysaccharide biosynthesis glycosyltransferase [Clostridium sp.]|uniref:PssE/Cps14G family polysaccharide biosynthesis glycosyltransferase n=1 Tax=Clostridium sp. TaxID=1506 RepID=UPI0026DC8439|nr:PssE/Cps14G family polysaccharide biosynthesis glycosyltransferase [Clostridium sp.]MDO5038273.1 PssE/Cps14G family polysaccharide biosynthesis glycosyltransferase [Clostridium sp.]
MIFVILGTHELEFKRLLQYLEDMDIKEEVIIQSGNTNFTSNKYKVIPFLDQNDFNKYIKESTLVITHGGVGSILTALRHKKKVITMPRLSKYNEHNDDHQLEICNKLSKEGYTMNCTDYDSLKEFIENYKKIELRPYIFDNSRLINFLTETIDNI